MVDRLAVESDRRHLRRRDPGLREQLERGGGVHLAQRGVERGKLGGGARLAARDGADRARELGVEPGEMCARSFHDSLGGAPLSDTSAASMPSTDVPVMMPT
jgi:hypothetical protein